MVRKLITCGLSFIVLGIVLGAFAAHGLEQLKVSNEGVASFEVGVRYLIINGLGLLLIAALSNHFDFILKLHFRSIFWGTIIFSGSIFGLVLLPQLNITINSFLGPITPIGGALMILGWFTLLIKYIRTA